LVNYRGSAWLFAWFFRRLRERAKGREKKRAAADYDYENDGSEK